MTIGNYEPLIQLLRAGGHRVTLQRLAVLDALRHFGGHVTAEQIQDYVRTRHHVVNPSTVYRTLDLLVGLDLVKTFTVDGAATRYELAASPHHHLVCRRCGTMVDLADHHLRDLSEHLRQEHGFRPLLGHLAIVGICASCEAALENQSDSQAESQPESQSN